MKEILNIPMGMACLAYDRCRRRVGRVSFMRSIGVQVTTGTRFYDDSRHMFGSGPWMISIGRNCKIATDVQFPVHDGGTTVLRKVQPDLEWAAPIDIGDDVFVDFRSIIFPEGKVGNRSIIGAESIVNRDIRTTL